MYLLRRFSFALALCFAASISVWGQTPMSPAAQVVYVATGGANVYAVTPGGAAAALITDASSYTGDTFSSLAVGPDNVSTNLPDIKGNTNFFLYACDSTNNTIIRLTVNTNPFDSKGNLVAASDVVSIYSGGLLGDGTTLSKPVCGRVDSNGDLYVSSRVSGSGVYVFSGVSTATSPTTAFPLTPTRVYNIGGSFTGGGITQKNNGDMLVVDTADNSILKAPFVGSNPVPPPSPNTTPFGTLNTSYITSNLAAPTNIARISTGSFFILDEGSNKNPNNVIEIDPTNLAAKPTVCATPPAGGTSLSSLATSEDNFLYVGVNAGSSNKQQVEVLDGLNCTAKTNPVQTISLANAGPPVAIAVPPVTAPSPTPTSTVDSFSNYVNQYNFGFSVFQAVTSTNCASSITVTQKQVPLSYLQYLVDNAADPSPLPGEPDVLMWYGGQALGDNGENGFGTMYTVSNPQNCAPSLNEQTAEAIGALFDTTQFANPRIIHCLDASDTCQVVSTTGTYPEGSTPGDGTTKGLVPGFSRFFLANGTLADLSNGGEPGTFCGFQNPLGTTTDPAQAPIVTGNNISVKFKLVAGSSASNCSSTNNITDAVALISVSKISSVVQGQPDPTAFQPITIVTQGSSTGAPPIFKYNAQSSNYQFSLNLKGYAKGTYALSVTFLTNNAPYAYTFFAIQ